MATSILDLADTTQSLVVSSSVCTDTPTIEYLDWWDRFLANRECRHKWSFPHTAQEMVAGHPARMIYPEGSDSHEVCHCCGLERFYSFRTMRYGPMFRRIPPTPELPWLPIRKAERNG